MFSVQYDKIFVLMYKFYKFLFRIKRIPLLLFASGISCLKTLFVLALDTRLCNTFDKLFLEDHEYDDHRNNRKYRACHLYRIVC